MDAYIWSIHVYTPTQLIHYNSHLHVISTFIMTFSCGFPDDVFTATLHQMKCVYVLTLIGVKYLLTCSCAGNTGTRQDKESICHVLA